MSVGKNREKGKKGKKEEGENRQTSSRQKAPTNANANATRATTMSDKMFNKIKQCSLLEPLSR